MFECVFTLSEGKKPPTTKDKMTPPTPSNWLYIRKAWLGGPVPNRPSDVLPETGHEILAQELPVRREGKDWASTCLGFQQVKQKLANDGCRVFHQGVPMGRRELKSKLGKPTRNSHSRIGPSKPHTPSCVMGKNWPFVPATGKGPLL